MTGRALIMAILENHMEDCSFDICGLLSIEEAAVKMGTSRGVVEALFRLGKIKGFKIDGAIYILESEVESQ